MASGYSHPIKSEVVITTLIGTCQNGNSITISLGSSDGVDKLLNLNGQIGRTSNLGKERATVLGKHRLHLCIGIFHFSANFIQK